MQNNKTIMWFFAILSVLLVFVILGYFYFNNNNIPKGDIETKEATIEENTAILEKMVAENTANDTPEKIAERKLVLDKMMTVNTLSPEQIEQNKKILESLIK